MKQGYIYLIQEREFIKTNEKIYKIGRTSQSNTSRVRQYPKGSMLLIQTMCSDCIVVELQLINLFKIEFIQRKEIGTEYFEGEHTVMIRHINDLCINANTQIKNQIILNPKNKTKQLKEKIKKLEKENEILSYMRLNIILVSHGEENLSKYISMLIVCSTSNGWLDAIPELLKWTNFNSDFPEFHNIYIPNRKCEYVMIYGKQWETKLAIDAIRDIYEKNKKFIMDNEDLFYYSLDEDQQIRYHRWVDYINNEDADELENYILETYKKIKLILFNQRNIPIQTRKQMGLTQKNKNII
jgi:hypothetical protein